VYGIGEIGEPVDLNTDTISLELIGCPVRAYGAASGVLAGEIQALFYRYRSIGGFDYTADLLIGPRAGGEGVATRPGDSGTVWFVDSDERPHGNGAAPAPRAPRLRPVALQWGGYVLFGAAGEQGMPFALATCLSTVLRELDLDVVRRWNIGHGEYWGKLGHYKIAATALGLVDNPRLKNFLLANLGQIAFPDDAIAAGNLTPSDEHFVPLADVADIVWRNTRPSDESNHFADMDQPGQGEFDGKTLLDLYAEDRSSLAIDTWNRFYDALGASKRGALPFRVWQMYEDMVERLRTAMSPASSVSAASCPTTRATPRSRSTCRCCTMATRSTRRRSRCTRSTRQTCSTGSRSRSSRRRTRRSRAAVAPRISAAARPLPDRSSI
jgi:hypothetical protein